jgi:hypothetical protein
MTQRTRRSMVCEQPDPLQFQIAQNLRTDSDIALNLVIVVRVRNVFQIRLEDQLILIRNSLDRKSRCVLV